MFCSENYLKCLVKFQVKDWSKFLSSLLKMIAVVKTRADLEFWNTSMMELFYENSAWKPLDIEAETEWIFLDINMYILAISWRRSLSYRNQSIDLQNKYVKELIS